MKKIMALLCAAAMALTAIPASAAELETEAYWVEFTPEEGPKMTAFEQALSDYFFNGGEAPKKSKLERITSLEVYGTVVLVNRTVEDFIGVESGSVIPISDYDGDEPDFEPYFVHLEYGAEWHYLYQVPKNAIKTKLISEMTNLKKLRIQDAKLKKINFVKKLTKLKDLTLSGSFEDISAVKDLKKLTSLYLNGDFTDISVIKGLKKLTVLDLYGYFKDISVLKKLKNLEKLSLGWSIEDLSALKGMTKLTLLRLNGSFRDVSALEGLKELTILSLDSDKEIKGLRALQSALPDTFFF